MSSPTAPGYHGRGRAAALQAMDNYGAKVGHLKRDDALDWFRGYLHASMSWAHGELGAPLLMLLADELAERARITFNETTLEGLQE